MTFKYSSSPSTSSLPSRPEDTSVAPYLTHIITHHGQVTLVPPQNQGRVRKYKRARGTNTIEIEQAGTARGPSTISRPPSFVGSTTPPSKKKRHPRIDASQLSLNISSHPLRSITPETQNTSSHLPPPPSYASLRSEVAVAAENDVISLSSSPSSDDFEDLTGLDLGSQWELDRMVGFTLEERVRREWNRRQPAMNRSMKHSPVSEHGGEIMPDCPPPPPPKGLSGKTTEEKSYFVPPPLAQPNPPKYIPAVTSGRSKPSPPHVPSNNISQSTQTGEAESSHSIPLFEDWHILDPVKQSPSPVARSDSDLAATSSGNFAASNLWRVRSENNENAVVHPTASTSDASNSGVAKGRDGSSGPFVQNAAIATISSPSTDDDSLQTASPRRSRRKGKEREVLPDRDINLAAIHSRPLPVPPSPSESRSPVVHLNAMIPSPRDEGSSSSTPQSKLASKTVDLPPHPGDSALESTSSLEVCFSGISVRDRIADIDSMRNRPVLPPPPDFLAEARAKRRPPPTPPSSYRLRGAGAQGSDPVRVDQPLDTGTDTKSRHSRIDIQASPGRIVLTGTRHNSDLIPPFLREVSSDLSSQTSSPRNQAFTTGGNDTGSAVLTWGQNSYAPMTYGTVPAVDSRERSLDSRCSESTTPQDAAPSAEPESFPRALTTELSPRAPLALPVDLSVAELSRRRRSADVPNTTAINFGGSGESLSPYTDLDVLLSRLEDASSGNRYEDLLIVSELLGPAQSSSTPYIAQDLPVGRIEVMRRRKLQDGRVKLKLSLLGVMVDRCGVCLSQFKDAEWAVLLPCAHPFHSACLKSWLARSHTCPLCRVNLNIS